MQDTSKQVSSQTSVEQSYLDGLLGIDDVEVVQLTNHCDETDVTADSEITVAVSDEEIEVDESIVVNDIESGYQLITVNGLSLAIDTANIANIIPWPKKVWIDADEKNWVIGLVAYNDTVIDLVPIASLINPANKEDMTLGKIDGESKMIVVLKGEKTGLICDAVGEQTSVDPSDICQRSSASKRQWLEGTVKNKGLAILDVAGIEKILKDEDGAE